ncbi:MAG: hypothetical protein AXW14_14905 [Alteromonas sp. Nap_26]|nr:MAG: hypothetical protein AXW14_14905 [Alteromonas sp. Nap_26]
MKKVIYRVWLLLPEFLRLPIDIIRRCPKWKNEGVLFIHVPKAAGYSVSMAIYGRALGHFYAKDVKRFCPNTFSDAFTFGVVRHPVDRLYSAYCFAKSGGTDVMGMRKPEQYSTAAFDSFESFVCEWLANQDLAQIDGVFRPQHFYLCDSGKIIVDEVFRLEEIDAGVEKLSAVLCREILIEHHNQSVEKNKIDISTETLSIIEQCYKKDFEIFGYRFGGNK